MERTGGEPDVVGHDEDSGEFIFYDCAPESPIGRRSLCYDREALDARKKHKPEGSAIDMARDPTMVAGVSAELLRFSWKGQRRLARGCVHCRGLTQRG